MDLDNERESILRQQVTPTQKAHMFINRAHELQLGRSQWQVLVWPLPIDIIDAIGRVWQQKGSVAQPDIGFSTQDLQRIQQAVAANLSVHPYFVDLVNRHIPEGTATKSELDQVRKYTKQGKMQGKGVHERMLQ